MKKECCLPGNARLTTVKTQHTGHERIRYQWRCKTCGRFVSRQYLLPFEDLDESLQHFRKTLKESLPTFQDFAQALSTLQGITVKEAARRLKAKLKRLVTR